MANYANLLATIAANIYTNGNNEVTAAMVKTAVDQMVASLGAGYQFMGVAHPADTPTGYADLKCYWIAYEPGTYTDFGGQTISTISLITYDAGAWSLIGIPSTEGFPIPFSAGYGYIDPYGQIEVVNSYDLTPFVPVLPGYVVLYSGSVGSLGRCIAGYDENKQFHSILLVDGDYMNEPVTIPAGVKFIRACGRNENYIGNAYKYPSLGIMWEGDSYVNVFGALSDRYGLTFAAWLEGGYCYVDDSRMLRFRNLVLRDSSGKYVVLHDGVHQFDEENVIDLSGASLYVFYVTNSDFANGDTYLIPAELRIGETANAQEDIILGGINTLTLYMGPLNEMLNKSAELKEFAGKTFSVMGDSIGTDSSGDTPLFKITSNDVGNSITSWITWYDYNNSNQDTPTGSTKTIGGVPITLAMVGTQQTFTPAPEDIGKTLGTPRWSYNAVAGVIPWWKGLAAKLGMVFNASASWNGNSYTDHEESSNLHKIGYGWHPLQIARLANRDAAGNRIAPDVVFLCRGTNDATHAPYAKITDFGGGIDQIPADDNVTGGYGFKEALAKTISAVQQTYPNARIYVCTLSPFRRLYDTTFPMDNGEYTMQAYNKAVKEVAEYMGAGVIDFSKCWNFYNCVSEGFVNNSDYTHPTQKGQDTMTEQAVKDIR